MASARFAMTHMMLMLLSPVRCEAKNKSYRAGQRMGSLRYDIGMGPELQDRCSRKGRSSMSLIPGARLQFFLSQMAKWR